MKEDEKESKLPPIMSETIKALMEIDDRCECPFPSTCDAAMVGTRNGQPTVVCVDLEKKCKWRDKK